MLRNDPALRRNPALLLALLSLIAASALWPGGWFSSHEGIAPLERILALSYEIRNGDFYPRWLSTAYQSQGLPFFNFYSPMFYLTAAYLLALGLPLIFALKLVTGLMFFAGSLGMFLWVRKHCGAVGGLISAIIYLFLPYHFLDLYVRGAMAEFAALAILPFLFYGFDLSFSEHPVKGILVTGISLALLILTHNLSTLMILPFAVAYFLGIAIIEKSSWKQFVAATIGPMTGAGLSTFYWLPVILEKEYLGRFASVTSGYYEYHDHFLSPSQWISSYWGFGGSIPGVGDGIGFQLGLPLLLFAFVAAGYLIYARDIRKFAVISLVLGLCGLFMTTSLSSFLYELFPPLPYVQFPWRFLGPATMFLAAFAGLSAGLVDRFKQLKPVYLILICIFFAVFMSAEQRTVSGRMQVGAISSDHLFQQRQIGKLSMVDEYLPKWAKGDIHASTLHPRPLSDSTRIDERKIMGARASFVVSGETGTGILIPQFYFPGWQASIDGKKLAVEPGENGYLYIEVPSGTHTVEVWFGTTPPRIAGWLISILAAIVLVAIESKKVNRQH